MTPETVVRLVAEPDRLRVLGAVALGAVTPDAAVAASGLGAKAALVALRRLREQELVVGCATSPSGRSRPASTIRSRPSTTGSAPGATGERSTT
ncbi:hypothetical protein [Micromonospora sagamiensis]|uniref:hypothetical protein n=1 Tax=Micromonospora sagamiensis TaxID=47875 RepID=UPI0011A9140D|nr:hypothetical protein [Micromonospora sagamiensis]